MSHLTHAREADARTVLLIRAVEETDSEGRRLSELERRRAAEAAREGGKAGWPYLVARARRLEAVLGHAGPRLPGRRLRAWLPPLALAGALALGLATALVGPERRINLLSLPLFGILAWNLGLYLFWIVAALLSSGKARSGKAPFLSLSALPGFRPARGEGAAARFARLWAEVAAPLEVARLRRLLHLAALTVALGTVAGMYLRGLAFAYRVTWESTFLEAHHVERLLGWVLGPASWVSGIAIPPTAGLEAPDSGPAAVWIHLFAVTLLLAVGLPRLGLALREGGRAWRRARRLPVDLSATYFRRRLAEGRGEARAVVVVPYSFEPTEAARDALRSLLVEHLGSRTEVRRHPPLEYGQDFPEQVEGEARPLPLFHLRHTPETEVHGEALRRLACRLEPEERWAVVEEGGFGGDPERRENRRRLWRRLAREAGFEVLAADLAAADAETLADSWTEVVDRCRKSS